MYNEGSDPESKARFKLSNRWIKITGSNYENWWEIAVTFFADR